MSNKYDLVISNIDDAILRNADLNLANTRF